MASDRLAIRCRIVSLISAVGKYRSAPNSSSDRAEHGLQRGLLAEDGQPVRLDADSAFQVRLGGEVLRVRHQAARVRCEQDLLFSRRRPDADDRLALRSSMIWANGMYPSHRAALLTRSLSHFHSPSVFW